MIKIVSGTNLTDLENKINALPGFVAVQGLDGLNAACLVRDIKPEITVIEVSQSNLDGSFSSTRLQKETGKPDVLTVKEYDKEGNEKNESIPEITP